jgi:hypothetical protein
LQVDDDLCYNSKYKNANFIIKKKVTSWDKVLYLLNHKLSFIDFTFIVEDDVFIPSIKSIKSMFETYKNYDLVSSFHNSKVDDKIVWSHWDKCPTYLPKDCQRHSMVCALGLSRKLLKVVEKQVETYKELYFIEIIFNSLAEKEKMNIIQAPEFSTIVWRKKWCIEDFIEYKENWFHPVKDIESHINIRSLLRKF